MGGGEGFLQAEKTTKSKLRLPRGRGSTVGVPSGKHTMGAFSKGQAVAVDKAPPKVRLHVELDCDPGGSVELPLHLDSSGTWPDAGHRDLKLGGNESEMTRC